MAALSFEAFWILTWGSAVATGALVALWQGPRRGAGMAFMAVPLWYHVFAFVDSIDILRDPNSVLQPIPADGLARLYSNPLVRNIGYLGVGFWLWAGPGAWLPAPRRLARALVRHGFPTRCTEGLSVAWGFAWFPVLLGVAWAFDLVVQGAMPDLVNGDESRVWENMTPYHAVMISLAAGFGEEILYRGLLLLLLLAGARRILGDSPLAWGLALGGQAVVFGLAHAGYGTWYHVLAPTLFGLAAGLLTWRYGIWSAIVIHVVVDVFAIGVHAVPRAPWFGIGLVTLLAMNVVFSLAFMWTRKRSAQGEI